MTFLLKTGTIFVLMLMGILAGVFFTFSSFAMPGLDQTTPAAAIEAMQGINRAVRNPSFFVPFFLTPVFAGILAALAWATGRKFAALGLGAGAVIYLFGGFLLTVGYHIPMNEELALQNVETLGGDATAIWQTYSADWTPLNTVRTVVCLLAMVPLVLAFSKLEVQDTIA